MAILKLKTGIGFIFFLLLIACNSNDPKRNKKGSTTHQSADNEIRVGVLHSLSGTMSFSETDVKNATILAIEEINQAGGLLGKKIVPIVEDGASDAATFAEKGIKLIDKDKVDVIFGCWTSESRKAVLPVLEQYNHLLFYPVQYEGMEASKCIVYTGAAPNQQIIPAVEWMIKQGKKKFFLIGSDYVFPRMANKIIKALLRKSGASVAGEEYVPFGYIEFEELIQKIKQSGADAILNTLNGESNIGFFKQLAAAGIFAEQLPSMSFSIAEVELKGIGAETMKGHYAAWTYFMSMKTEKNSSFIKAYQSRYGADKVTDDPIEAGYFGVYLWAEAVKKANSTNIDKVREAIRGISYEAPQGKVTIDATNNHTFKNFMIGKVNDKVLFDIVYQSQGVIKPEPFPDLITNKRVVAPGKIVED